jgi:hypothetical protein
MAVSGKLHGPGSLTPVPSKEKTRNAPKAGFHDLQEELFAPDWGRSRITQPLA